MKKVVIFISLFCSMIVIGQQITYEIIKVQEMGFIFLPNNMEVQTGLQKAIAQQYLSGIGYYSWEAAGDRVVFQPKGLNAGQRSWTYARVIIRTFKGTKGENPLLDSSHKYSNQELIDNGINIRMEMQASGIKIVNWYGAENVMLNGKYNGVKTTYSRQIGNNPPVLTTMYHINNNDRAHGITFSYRESDRAYWEPIYKKIIESIIIEKR